MAGGGSSTPVIDSSVADKSRVLQIRMHDLPISGHEIQKVVVGIEKIEVHHAGKGWITVASEPQRYDLLELQNGVSVIIFERPLDPGKYTQIRLVLSEDNEVFVEGLPYRLRIPSGEQTGIKLITPFEIEEGKMVEVTLDFDAQSSVKLDQSQGFRLKPVIKVERVAEYDGLGIVTPLGGNVSNLDGDFNLIFPPDAVDKSILVSMNEVKPGSLSGSLPANTVLVSKAYNFEPDGYHFLQDVILQVSVPDQAINGLGARENLVILTYDNLQQAWVKLPSTVVSSANIVQARLSHFSVYAAAVEQNCGDGVENGDETGIDCGGSCPAQCVDCNDYQVLAGNDPSGSGPMAGIYSFGDEAVREAARSALQEYAEGRGEDWDDEVTWVELLGRYTPDQKMEAVSRYVHRHMAYMYDDGELNWEGVIPDFFIPLSALSLSPSSLFPSPSDILKNPGSVIDDLNPFDSLPGLLPSHLIPFNDVIRGEIENLFEKLLAEQITALKLDEFLHMFNELICNLAADNQLDIDPSDWDPLFGFFMNEVYEKIYSLFPDARPQTAAYTVGESLNREGEGNDAQGNSKVAACSKLYTNSIINKEVDPDIDPTGAVTRYCGDCEDFAILRSSLLRHLGVSSKCVMNMDAHNFSLWSATGSDDPDGDVPIDINGPDGAPGYHDYETAQNLFEMGGSNAGAGGHTFNVVLYQNKYRIMDYGELRKGHYAFVEKDHDSDIHNGDHVWNDLFGRHWFPEFSRVSTLPVTSCVNITSLDFEGIVQLFGLSLNYISPGSKTRNYPGPVACYEPGQTSWTYRTLYFDVCP